MPRIGGIRGPYRVFFTSFDCSEPPHVHVEREDKTCKFWLEPVELASNYGFSSRELNEIGKLVEQNERLFLEAWNEHFSQH